MKEINKLIVDDNLRIELHNRMGQNLQKLLEAFEGEDFSRM